MEIASTTENENIESTSVKVDLKTRRVTKRILSQIILNCKMSFDDFPFDSQNCYVKMFHPNEESNLTITGK